MSFILDKFQQAQAENHALHTNHVNDKMVKVLKIIGFDRGYVKAQGCSLWDAEGREYLDFLAGYSVFNLGHNPRGLQETLREVLNHSWPNLVQMDLAALSGQLAHELSQRDPTGRLVKCYFGNSGAEAVECALKFAKAATKRSRLLAFAGGFHGLSMGALSLCGDSSWREGFGPFLPGCKVINYGDLAELEAELASREVAGLIIEPIQGEGGVRELSQIQWNEIQRLCKKYGTLLILDEIQTGMGRTGKFFAFEHFNLEPDLVCLSKALSNGMVPVSATLGTAKVFNSVYSSLDRCMVHSSTFSENNLAMAAALWVLNELDEKKLIHRAQQKGEEFIKKIKQALTGFELVREIRGRGMMLAVEFGAPKENLSLKMGWSLIQKANKGLFGQMITMPLLKEHRILSQVAGHNLNVLKLSPPLILEDTQIDYFVQALKNVVTQAHRFPGGVWEVGLGLAKHAVMAQV